MKKLIAVSMALAAVGLVLSADPARAEVVQDVATSGALQNALLVARSNNDDDVINLAAGTYKIADNAGNSFRYIPVGAENKSLTIIGAGADVTILDGGLSDQIMELDTTNVVGDVDTEVSVRGITFFHGKVAGTGGGLFAHTTDATISIVDCTFNRNEAVSGGVPDLDGGGGGASLLSKGNGSFFVSDSVFTANQAEDSGGLLVLGFIGDGAITRNVFHGNKASSTIGGVGFFTLSGHAVFSNNVLDKNTGQNLGGGASIRGVGADIVNNVFFDNFAGAGGGLQASGDEIRIENNIFADNSGGAATDIFVDDGSSSLIQVFNNIFSDFCLQSGSCDVATLGANQNNNLIGADPLFVDAATGDFHLQPGSPAIDAGNAEAPSLPDIDFEGDPRINGPAPDMGADETVSEGTTGSGTTGGGGDGGGCSLIR